MYLAIFSALCLSACSSGEEVKAEALTPAPSELTLEYPTTISPELADRFSALALTCVHQEFPNKISRTTNTAEAVSYTHLTLPTIYSV